MKQTNNRKRALVNVAIVVLVAVAWLMMFFFGGDDLAARGLRSLKYFTVQSNLLAGAAAIVWILQNRKGTISRGAEIFKYVAATAVFLTFMTVMVFLGPLYGYPMMFVGANLFFHLVVPVMCILEVIFMTDTDFTPKDNLIAVIPMVLYGIFYLGNNRVNGIGEWPDTNDWYSFLAWGWGIGILVFVVMMLATWLLGLFLRKMQKFVRARRS